MNLSKPVEPGRIPGTNCLGSQGIFGRGFLERGETGFGKIYNLYSKSPIESPSRHQFRSEVREQALPDEATKQASRNFNRVPS